MSVAIERPTRTRKASTQPAIKIIRKNPGGWPNDILEAYARPRGPYTVENAETILDQESVELYHGWLVWQEMTNARERRVVANINDMLSLPARMMNFGQVLPDQLECLLKDGSDIKPDTSLISWQRMENNVKPRGPRNRPILSGCPELVVEVRSPSNWRKQERRKRKLYFANGAEIVWDVDERNEEIWVYRVENPEEPTHFSVEEEIDCEPLLPGWRRQVADIFAERASAEALAGEMAQTWRAEGVEIGKAEGLELGKAEGMIQTLRSVLPMLARARFAGDLPDNLTERLNLYSLAQLQQLQHTLEKASTVEDWLALS